ncbi:UNVERIFIED_CONTAM: hypothetical protein GTU68_015754 [Idotea baltica]|nr:hypothetical protein [Idotea baltica]
MVHFWRI